MNSTFLSTHECVKNFPFRDEAEFYTDQIGYHDFHVIPPVKSDKIQKFYTIHIVVSGKGYLHYRDKILEISKNDVFVLPPNELIGYYPDPKDPWDYIFFTFNGSKAPQYVKDLGFSPEHPIRICKNPSFILPIFKSFFDKHHQKIPVSYFETVSLLFLLFSSVCSNHSIAITQESTPSLVQQAVSLIQLHYLSSSLTVEYIANNLYISHAMLCKLFKAEKGITIIAYINNCRMEYAEELLRNTSLTAVEIAYMSGYREYTYFLMKFKKKHNMTTQEYRQLHQKK